VGVLVFLFYQFVQPPVFFNKVEKEKLYETPYAGKLIGLETEHHRNFQEKSKQVKAMVEGMHTGDEAAVETARQNLTVIETKGKAIRAEVKGLLKTANPKAETKDTDYVFLTFVMQYMPEGMIGILLAVIFCASMSSTASELNALASTTVIDLYRRSVKTNGSDAHYLIMSRLFIVVWGILAIFFASMASRLDNLIQAVNILGSLFYGTILGIFVVAFYFKYIKARAVFWAALLAEGLVILIFVGTDIAFLWLNPIGCLLVIFFGYLFQFTLGSREART
jgi:SSS family solute:Na+ symporter